MKRSNRNHLNKTHRMTAVWLFIVLVQTVCMAAPMTIYDAANLVGEGVDISETHIIYAGNVGIPGDPLTLNNRISSFKLNQGYMAVVGNNNTTGGNGSKTYIANDGDLIVNHLDEMDDLISFIRVLPWTNVTKKAFCGDLLGVGPNGVLFDKTELNVGSYYRWWIRTDAGSNSPPQYVPMAYNRNHYDDTDMANIVDMTQVSHVLGLNEPDNYDTDGGGTGVPVWEAINIFPNLEKTGLRIGSPSCTEFHGLGLTSRWLPNFMQQADAENIRVDYIGVHWYDWGSDPLNDLTPAHDAIFDRFKKYLSQVYAQYRMPIWITEFNANKWRNTARQEEFLLRALPYLETLGYVERYMYFQPFGGNGDFFDTNDVENITITTAGEIYRDHVSTPSYTSNILPAPWQDQDIGDVATAGDTIYAYSNFTVCVGGEGITNTADEFRYVYQPLTSNGTIVARVNSLVGQNDLSMGGVMIRETLASNSCHAGMFISDSGGARFQHRLTTGGDSGGSAVAGIEPPNWVKMERVGNTLTGSYSLDGSDWIPVGTQTVSMTETVYIGLAASSYDDSLFDSTGVAIGYFCDAVFTDVSVVTGAVNNPPVWDWPPTVYNAEVGVNFSESISWRASDPESVALRFYMVSGPADWLSMSLWGGQLTGTPGLGDVGTTNITLSVWDGVNDPVEVTVALTVSPRSYPFDIWSENFDGDVTLRANDHVLMNDNQDNIFQQAGSVVANDQLEITLGTSSQTRGAVIAINNANMVDTTTNSSCYRLTFDVVSKEENCKFSVAIYDGKRELGVSPDPNSYTFETAASANVALVPIAGGTSTVTEISNAEYNEIQTHTVTFEHDGDCDIFLVFQNMRLGPLSAQMVALDNIKLEVVDHPYLYWDTDVTKVGLQATASGAWGTNGTTTWGSTTSGNDPLLEWADGNYAVFEPQCYYPPVPLVGTVQPIGLIFNGIDYKIDAGENSEIELSHGGIEANETVIIVPPIKLMSDQIWNVASNKTLTIRGVVSTNGLETLTKSGAGTLTLITQNNLEGGSLVINDGTVAMTFNNETIHNNVEITINNGATLDIRENRTLNRATGALITVDGGTLTQTLGGVNMFNEVTLKNGATWSRSSSLAGQHEISGDIVVRLGGSTASTITMPDTNNGLFIKAAVLFTVANVTGDEDVDLIVDADIQSTENIRKDGLGTLEFRKASEYTDRTRILNGTLLVNNTTGSGTGTGRVQVESAQSVLGGTGSIDGEVFVTAGTLAPGNSVGTLTVSNDVTFASGAIYKVEVTPSSTVSDTLNVSGGDLTLDGATLVIVGTISGAGTTIALVTGTIIDTFDGLPDGAIVQAAADGNPDYHIHYYTGTPQDPTAAHITINQDSAITPTSSGVDVRAYQAADGVYVEFVAYDVEQDGTIRLALLDAEGDVVWEGSVAVTAGAEVIARFLVPGLEAGDTYDFVLRDEMGQSWSAPGVTVGTFETEMVSASLTSATLSFDSLPERNYEVQWTAELGGTWQTVTHLTADSEQTSVVVDYPEGPTGFFRIQLK